MELFFTIAVYETVHKMGHNPNVEKERGEEGCEGEKTIPAFVFVINFTAICEQNLT